MHTGYHLYFSNAAQHFQAGRYTVEPVNPDPGKYGHLRKTARHVWPQMAFRYSTYIDNLENADTCKLRIPDTKINSCLLHLHKFPTLIRT